jgi:hypothetical protein
MLIRLALFVAIVISWSSPSVAGESVLRGFVPITFDQDRLEAHLHERIYRWDNSLLPSAITSRAEVSASIKLVWRVNGKEIVLAPEKISVLENTAARVVVEASSKPADGVEVRAKTILDYDGVATISLDISSRDATTVGGLILEAQIPRHPSHTVLAYRAETIRMRDTGRKDSTGKDDVLDIPYRGDFLNVLDFSDGDRSFWWFADNASGWDWANDNPTEVSLQGDAYVLRQFLLGSGAKLSTPKHIQFGILSTPVRPMSDNWRLQRLSAWLPTAKDKELSAKLFFYWEKGLAYDALPYAHFPDRVVANLPNSDRDMYAGAAENKKTVRKFREQYGADLLPYYPLHLLSTVDPLVVKHRAEWEMDPPEVWHDMVGGYPIRYEKTQVSLRAPGVVDHIVEGLTSAIDELDVNGIYFDHGPVKDSKNPLNGAWTDCTGRTRGSLDIWATRDLIKRLRTEFERRGKPGIIIVHDSNREIIPAYTFAFGLLDGEQFRTKLQQGDYLLQTSIPEFRSRFASDQYGVPTYWLAGEWFHHEDSPYWFLTEEARTAYRRMMGLALLHDVLDWPHRAHPQERESLLKTLDAFGIAQSTFYGYWGPAGQLSSSDKDVLVSRYVNNNTNNVLYIVVNVSSSDKNTTLLQAPNFGPATLVQKKGEARAVKPGAPINVSIAARDFIMIIESQQNGFSARPMVMPTADIRPDRG